MINNGSKSSYMRCVNFGVKLARWIRVNQQRRLRKCMLNGLVRKLSFFEGKLILLPRLKFRLDLPFIGDPQSIKVLQVERNKAHYLISEPIC